MASWRRDTQGSSRVGQEGDGARGNVGKRLSCGFCRSRERQAEHWLARRISGFCGIRMSLVVRDVALGKEGRWIVVQSEGRIKGVGLG